MVKEGFLEERLLSIQEREKWKSVYQMKNPGSRVQKEEKNGISGKST